MNRMPNVFSSAPMHFKVILCALTLLALVFPSSAQLGLPPIILIPPANQNAIPGSDARFSVETDVSLTPLSYQWQFKGKDIQDATSKTYVRKNVQPAHIGRYSVKVSNAAGTVTSNAELSVDDTPVRISSAFSDANGLKVNITGPLVATYVIEVSSDIKSWTPISTNLVITGILDLTVPFDKSVARYYRVRAY